MTAVRGDTCTHGWLYGHHVTPCTTNQQLRTRCVKMASSSNGNRLIQLNAGTDATRLRLAQDKPRHQDRGDAMVPRAGAHRPVYLNDARLGAHENYL